MLKLIYNLFLITQSLLTCILNTDIIYNNVQVNIFQNLMSYRLGQRSKKYTYITNVCYHKYYAKTNLQPIPSHKFNIDM